MPRDSPILSLSLVTFGDEGFTVVYHKLFNELPKRVPSRKDGNRVLPTGFFARSLEEDIHGLSAKEFARLFLPKPHNLTAFAQNRPNPPGTLELRFGSCDFVSHPVKIPRGNGPGSGTTDGGTSKKTDGEGPTTTATTTAETRSARDEAKGENAGSQDGRFRLDDSEDEGYEDDDYHYHDDDDNDIDDQRRSVISLNVVFGLRKTLKVDTEFHHYLYSHPADEKQYHDSSNEDSRENETTPSTNAHKKGVQQGRARVTVRLSIRRVARNLALALKNEELRCGYLTAEVRRSRERRDQKSSPNEQINVKWPLDATLDSILAGLCSHKQTARVRINGWMGLDLTLGSVISDFSEANVHPHHTLLLGERPSVVLRCLPEDASPLLVKIIKNNDPTKSFKEMSAALAVNLYRILKLARHVVVWRLGKIVPTITAHSIFGMPREMSGSLAAKNGGSSNSAHSIYGYLDPGLTSDSSGNGAFFGYPIAALSEEFRTSFQSKNFGLLGFLSTFNRLVPLKEHVQKWTTRGLNKKDLSLMLRWAVNKNLLVPYERKLFRLPPPSSTTSAATSMSINGRSDVKVRLNIGLQKPDSEWELDLINRLDSYGCLNGTKDVEEILYKWNHTEDFFRQDKYRASGETSLHPGTRLSKHAGTELPKHAALGSGIVVGMNRGSSMEDIPREQSNISLMSQKSFSRDQSDLSSSSVRLGRSHSITEAEIISESPRPGFLGISGMQMNQETIVADNAKESDMSAHIAKYSLSPSTEKFSGVKERIERKSITYSGFMKILSRHKDKIAVLLHPALHQ